MDPSFRSNCPCRSQLPARRTLASAIAWHIAVVLVAEFCIGRCLRLLRLTLTFVDSVDYRLACRLLLTLAAIQHSKQQIGKRNYVHHEMPALRSDGDEAKAPGPVFLRPLRLEIGADATGSFAGSALVGKVVRQS